MAYMLLYHEFFCQANSCSWFSASFDVCLLKSWDFEALFYVVKIEHSLPCQGFDYTELESSFSSKNVCNVTRINDFKNMNRYALFIQSGHISLTM